MPDSLVERLSKLADHLYGIDSGSGDAKLIYYARDVIRQHEEQPRHVPVREERAETEKKTPEYSRSATSATDTLIRELEAKSFGAIKSITLYNDRKEPVTAIEQVVPLELVKALLTQQREISLPSSGLDPLIVVAQEALDVMEDLKKGRSWGERASWAVRNLRQEMQVHLKNKLKRE